MEANSCVSQRPISKCLWFPCWDRSAIWGSIAYEAGTWMNSICNVCCHHNMQGPLSSEQLRYIIGKNFPTLAEGTWASKQLDLHRMKLMGLVAGLVNWIGLIVLSSQAAGLHLKMKLMGLASTICLLIIVAFLLPSPVTTAPTLFSHLRDSLTKIGGPRGGGGGPRGGGGGPHGEPSRTRAKLSSPPTPPTPLVPSFGVRRLKWNWTTN